MNEFDGFLFCILFCLFVFVVFFVEVGVVDMLLLKLADCYINNIKTFLFYKIYEDS